MQLIFAQVTKCLHQCERPHLVFSDIVVRYKLYIFSVLIEEVSGHNVEHLPILSSLCCSGIRFL